jgi:hypothetical protein
MNTVMNHRVSYTMEKLSTSWVTITFSRISLLSSVCYIVILKETRVKNEYLANQQ